MKKLFVVVLLLLLFLTLFTTDVQAVVFLPAIILIPIANIVAVVIGGFSVPILGVAALWSKFARISIKKTMLIVSMFLLFLVVILIVFLKLHNPDRSFF